MFFGLFGTLIQMANAFDCVNINTAPKEELEKIIHIGPSRAAQIINLREEALFSSLDDLERVVGISPARLADIKKQGLAWVDLELEPSKIKKEIEPPEKELAAISEPLKSLDLVQNKQIPKPLSVFLIALGLAIFSGTIILILKKKLKHLS